MRDHQACMEMEQMPQCPALFLDLICALRGHGPPTTQHENTHIHVMLMLTVKAEVWTAAARTARHRETTRMMWTLSELVGGGDGGVGE